MLQFAPQAVLTPTASPWQKRNTLADWMFYDVGNLTAPEFNMLAGSMSPKGTILVVEPTGGADDIRIHRYADDSRLRAAPGRKVQHFAIAGVGSSDVGAASLARTRANQLGKPVGAIVAGYGMANLLQEALGGWFFFGAANRMQAWMDRYQEALTASETDDARRIEDAEDAAIRQSGNAARTLMRLLAEDARGLKSVVGHSKGCLSIAFALNDLKNEQGAEALAPFKDLEIITAGAVVELPAELRNVRQYLGAIDWFGGLNSIPGVPCIRVPHAWHHLNTDLPYHMDFAQVLQGHYDPA